MSTNKIDHEAYETLSNDQLAQASGGFWNWRGAPQSYTVQRGDNLTNIARASHLSLSNLLQMNPQYQKNPNLIYPGQRVITGWQPSGWQAGWRSGGRSSWCFPQ